MATTTPNHPIVPTTVPIAIIGTDAVLAAAPATPVQLAHACLRAGFANVIPASWGDELIAAAVLRRLPQFGNGPAIQCSCPIVAHRLLSASGDLRPVLLPLVPPPVAVARYLRSLARPSRTRITYIGACPGATDESIDIRMSPDALIAMLAERDIIVADQPEVFESIIPPDRRRFRSQPGGVPTAEALWTEFGARTLVEIDGEDFVTEVAQHLLTGKNVLIDASTRLGCACSGASSGARNPRAEVIAHEPPRATSPVVEERTPIDLDLAVPAVSRTPIDVVAVSTATPSTHLATPANGIEAIVASRAQAAHAAQATQTAPAPQHTRTNAASADVRLPRLSTPVVPRAVLSAFPQSRDFEGKALPRAYVARRRSSPRGVSVVLPPDDFAAHDAIVERAAEQHAPVGEETRAIAAEQHAPIREEIAASASAPTSVERAPEPTPAIVAPVLPGVPVMPESVLVVESAATPNPIEAVTPVPATPAPMVEPDLPSIPVATSIPTPSHAVHSVSDPAFAQRVIAPAVNDADPVEDPIVTPASIAAQPRTSRVQTPPRSARPVPARPAPPTVTTPTSTSFSRGQIVLILIAVAAIAICASTVVAVIVSRSVTATSLNTTPSR